MITIRKCEIIGARIVDISYTYKITEDGLDERFIYFTTDRGFSFLMPFAGAPWERTSIPEDAKPFAAPESWFGRLVKSRERKIFDRIKKSPIAGVLGELENPDETVIILDDGSRISNTMVAPHGTGAAGLYYLQRSEQTTSINHLKDFFDIPIAPG